MTLVQPTAPRAKIEERPDSVTVTIPVRRTCVTYLLLLFLGGFLVGWAGGERAAILALSSYFTTGHIPGYNSGATSPFGIAMLVAWLLFWTFCGLALVYVAIWTLAGREVITATSHGIGRAFPPLPLPRPKHYPAGEITGLHMTNVPLSWWEEVGWIGFMPDKGAVAFECRGKTVHLASEVDPAEGGPIMQAILAQLPMLAHKAEGPRRSP